MFKVMIYYSLVCYFENVECCCNIVLGQMVCYGYLDVEVKDLLIQLFLEMDYWLEGYNKGLVIYFCEYLWYELDDILKDYIKFDGIFYNLYIDGFCIYIFIDVCLQCYVEEAVQEEMIKVQGNFYEDWKKGIFWGSSEVLEWAVWKLECYQKLKDKGFLEEVIDVIFQQFVFMMVFSWEKGEEEWEMSLFDFVKYYFILLNVGFFVVDLFIGLIKVWVGGIDYKYFQYDYVFVKWQVGFIFKLVVYVIVL